MNPIDAVIFDLDGTIIDSESFHLEAWNLVLKHYGHTPPSPHWNDDTIGLPDTCARDKTISLFPDMAEHHDSILGLKQELYRDLVRRQGVRLAFPGVHERLGILRDRGIPLAVGTNSAMINTMTCLEAAELVEFFPVVVTLDRVKHGKPAPDIYLEAALQLGVQPERSVVLEDSAAGILAAQSAGCIVLGLANSSPIHELPVVHAGFPTTADALDWVIGQIPAARTA